jgi:hypothetical protein
MALLSLLGLPILLALARASRPGRASEPAPGA